MNATKTKRWAITRKALPTKDLLLHVARLKGWVK